MGQTTPIALDLADVTVRRGGRVVLDRVSARVDAGAFVHVVGPVGSARVVVTNASTRSGVSAVRCRTTLVGCSSATRASSATPEATSAGNGRDAIDARPGPPRSANSTSSETPTSSEVADERVDRFQRDDRERGTDGQQRHRHDERHQQRLRARPRARKPAARRRREPDGRRARPVRASAAGCTRPSPRRSPCADRPEAGPVGLSIPNTASSQLTISATAKSVHRIDAWFAPGTSTTRTPVPMASSP